MKAGKQEMIRDLNTRLVLEAIIQHDPISRAELSSLLGLTKATVSSIVTRLLEQHLIRETGSRDTSKGRKPIMLTFAKENGHVLSIDLTGRQIVLMTCNLRGEDCRLYQYANHYSPSALLQPLKLLIQKTMDTLPPTIHGVIGITVGVHAAVHDNTILFCPYYDLTGLPLAQELEHTFHIPVFIENEANFSALGEKTFCHDYSNMINLSIHTGIGLGLILNHQLYTGRSGFAGEFGHTIVEAGGRPCPCGNRGCIEQYASEPAILREYAELACLSSPTVDDLIADYRRQSPPAVSAIRTFTKYMAIAINNIATIFNPDIIIINSSFTSYLPDIIPMIQERLSRAQAAAASQSHPASDKLCPLIPSTLQDTAILLGGAAVCIRDFLGILSLRL